MPYQAWLRGGYYCPCFTDELEIQRGQVICLRTPSPSLSLTLALINFRLLGAGGCEGEVLGPPTLPVLCAEFSINWTLCPQYVVQPE